MLAAGRVPCRCQRPAAPPHPAWPRRADLLDPLYHEAATGRPSVNLDGWMLSKEQCLATFHRHAAGADVCIVEGVMVRPPPRRGRASRAGAWHPRAGVAYRRGAPRAQGLYDARDSCSEEGSTAQMAKWLGAPAVLVLDCFALARSAAAMVKARAPRLRGAAWLRCSARRATSLRRVPGRQPGVLSL